MAVGLAGYASVLWRGATGSVDGDDDLDVVFAGGGDLYPQNVFALAGCEHDGDEKVPFRGLKRLDDGPPYRGTPLASPQFGFFTQVHVANIVASVDGISAPGDEIIAGLVDHVLPWAREETVPRGGIVVYHTARLDKHRGCAQKPGSKSELRRQVLLDQARVVDFAVGDVDGDGDLDLVVAFEGWREKKAVIDSFKAESITNLELWLEQPPVTPDRAAWAEPRRGPPISSLCEMEKRTAPPVRESHPIGPRHIVWSSLSGTSNWAIGIFLNEGGGTFAPLGALTPESLYDAVREAPTRVAVADINGDGALDIVGSFQGHSIFAATGPFDADTTRVACRGVDESLKTAAEGTSFSCVATEQAVADIDVAVVEHDGRTEAIVATTSWCDPTGGHTELTCQARPAVKVWWPASGRSEVLHTACEADEDCDDASALMLPAVALVRMSPEDRLTAVFSTAVDPFCMTGDRKVALRSVNIDGPERDARPLQRGTCAHLPADLVPLPRAGPGTRLVARPSPAAGVRARVTLPGAGPYEVLDVSWRGVHHRRCEGEATDGCWVHEPAARAVLVPAIATDATVSYRIWTDPNLLVVDAAPGRGIVVLSATSSFDR